MITEGYRTNKNVLSFLVLLSILIEVMSIFMDIIILAIYYPSGELWSSTEKFSAVMAIFNLTLR